MQGAMDRNKEIFVNESIELGIVHGTVRTDSRRWCYRYCRFVARPLRVGNGSGDSCGGTLRCFFQQDKESTFSMGCEPSVPAGFATIFVSFAAILVLI